MGCRRAVVALAVLAAVAEGRSCGTPAGGRTLLEVYDDGLCQSEVAPEVEVCCSGNSSEWGDGEPWEGCSCGHVCRDGECMSLCVTDGDCDDEEKPTCFRSDTIHPWGRCEEKQHWWLVGVGLSLAGSIIGNFGMQLQKVAHAYTEKLSAKEQERRKRVPCRMPVWVLGVLLMFTGSLMDMASMAFAAQSLLAPLASSTILINFFMVPVVVGERPSLLDVVAGVFIMIGAVLAVYFAQQTTPAYSLMGMLSGFAAPSFLIWWSFLMAALMVMVVYMRRAVKEGRLLAASKTDGREMRLYAGCLASIGGLIGGNSMLFGKTVMEAIKLVGREGLSHGGAAVGLLSVTFALLAASIFLQMKYLNNALELFDVLLVFPVYQAVWILSSTVNGLLFYKEYASFSQTAWVFFPLGVTLSCLGILAIAVGYSKKNSGKAMNDEKLVAPGATVQALGPTDPNGSLPLFGTQPPPGSTPLVSLQNDTPP